jgi:hypothetical protein
MNADKNAKAETLICVHPRLSAVPFFASDNLLAKCAHQGMSGHIAQRAFGKGAERVRYTLLWQPRFC